MEGITRKFPTDEVFLGLCGDIQWSGENGSTAQGHLSSYIKEVLGLGGYFLGFGDYVDFLSPSNRARLQGASLYDTALDVIENAAYELVADAYKRFFKGTEKRWLGLLHGHHYYEFADGETTDTWLCSKLGAPYLGTSAIVRIIYGKKLQNTVTVYCHHGVGSGSLPAAGLNKLYHTAQSFDADVIAMGHNTKLATAAMPRMRPTWDDNDEFSLTHKEMRLVNTGGFNKSNIVGHKKAGRPHGDYAEEKMLGGAPLGAPILHLRKDGSIRVTS